MTYTDHLGRKHLFLLCSCAHPDHVLRVTLEQDEEGEPWLSFSTLINQHNSWWKRIVTALRYVFKLEDSLESVHWDEVLLNANQAHDFFMLLKQYRDAQWKLRIERKRAEFNP